jgi:hypothetical protein
MKPPRFKIAGFISRFILTRFGFAAIVSPWRTVYILREHWYDAALRRHELAHLGQMRRDGWFKFWVQCLWWYFNPGYERSPYEIEARLAEHNPKHPLLGGYAF